MPLLPASVPYYKHINVFPLVHNRAGLSVVRVTRDHTQEIIFRVTIPSRYPVNYNCFFIKETEKIHICEKNLNSML